MNTKYAIECWTGGSWEEESRFYLYESALAEFNSLRHTGSLSKPEKFYRLIEVHMES